MAAQTLIRWGGLVMIVTALLFAAGGVIQTFARSALGESIVLASAVLLVFTFITLYAAQAERSGVIGLAGFLLGVSGASLATIPVFLLFARLSGVEEARVVLKYSHQILITDLSNAAWMLGLVLMGIAAWRTGIFPSTAALLLSLAAAATLITNFAPVDTPLPFLAALLLLGAALAWIGWVLFAGTRERARQPQPAASTS